MEKATNKDAFKKYREREAAETTGTRSGRKYKETYKGAKIMPLLVEGTQLKYVPWGGRDVEMLKSKLPSLKDGANSKIIIGNYCGLQSAIQHQRCARTTVYII